MAGDRTSMFVIGGVAALLLMFFLTSGPSRATVKPMATSDGSVPASRLETQSGSTLQLEDMKNNEDLSEEPNFSNMSIEAVREYWNKRPCNLKHSKEPVGTKKYFDEVEAKKYKVEPHIPGFARFEKWQGKKVLEVGCGMATDGTNFARAGADYHGIDLTDEGIKLAKKRFQVFGLKGHLQQCNAERLSSCFPAGTKFDLIYSFGVIHHSPHPDVIVKEMKKLLKPGGTLKLMVYSKISFKLFWVMKETDVWDFSKLDSMMAKYSEAQVGSPVTYTYTFDELTALVGPSFRVTELYKDHIFKYDVEKYKQGEYVIDSMWQDVSPELFRAFERELGWHTMITAIYEPDS
jgi:2-polyprenyl-3-methyl-5-hydroxy-6-metoxy-1,4-benzoquinol methylase